MNAADVMSRDPETLTSSATLADAVRLMDAELVRHLPIVTEHGRLVGMLSDRDLRGVARTDGSDPALQQSVCVVAQHELVTVHPETELRIVVDLLIDRRIGAVPVVESDGHRLVGIVSIVDILRALRTLV